MNITVKSPFRKNGNYILLYIWHINNLDKGSSNTLQFSGQVIGKIKSSKYLNVLNHDMIALDDTIIYPSSDDEVVG